MLAALGQAVSATKHISSADGLSNDFVLSLAVDKQGYVWAGTEAGVNRIAGKTIQPFLTSEWTKGRITALYWYDEAGLMLVGTERGLTVYNPAGGLTRQLTFDDGLVRSSINDIAKGDGGVWLAYGNGQVQLLNGLTLRVKSLELSQTYGNRCVMDDGRGHLYIGHTQHGMTVVDLSNGLAKNFQQQNNEENGLPDIPGQGRTDMGRHRQRTGPVSSRVADL